MAYISKILVPVPGSLPEQYDLKDKECRQDLEALSLECKSITSEVVDQVTSQESE